MLVIKGYFTPQGIFENSFDLKMPKHAKSIRLRALTWTEYRPAMHRSAPWSDDPEITGQPTTCAVQLGKETVPFDKLAGKTLLLGDEQTAQTVSLPYKMTLHALQGNAEEALIWLERAFENGFDDWNHIMVDSDIASVRDTDEFKRLKTEFME